MDLSNKDYQGSCKGLIERASGKKAGREEIARAVQEWILNNGGQFFRNQEGQLSLMWNGKIYLVGGRHDTNPDYYALIYELTGYISSEKDGRQFFEYLQNIALLQSRDLKSYTWGFSELQTPKAYFNPNDDKGRIVKIETGGWQLIANGSNPDEILLIPSKKLGKISIRNVENSKEILLQTYQLLQSCLATDQASQAVLFGWLLTLPLIDLCTPRPLIRLEGDSQSGKTTACKLIYQLIYGRPHKGTATVAANWRDAAASPLVLIDNLECENMKREGLIDFLLLVVRLQTFSDSFGKKLRESFGCHQS